MLTNSCNKVTTVFTSVYSRYRVQHGWASVLTEHISQSVECGYDFLIIIMAVALCLYIVAFIQCSK